MTQPMMPEPLDLVEPYEPMKERLSTFLDTLGILAIAIGTAWGLFSVLGPYAVAIGGVIAIGLNALAGLARGRVVEPETEPVEQPRLLRPLPGPEDSGNLHVSGR